MVEQNPYIAEYSTLSIKERHELYKRLWESLPPSSSSDFMRAFRNVANQPELVKLVEVGEIDNPCELGFPEVFPGEIEERRERSEAFQIMLSRLDALLSFTQITKSFREFILWGYEIDYATGVDKGEKPICDLSWTMDIDNPKYAGIFDPERVKDLEQQGYRQSLENTLSVLKMVQERDPEFLNRGLTSFEGRGKMQVWREEFVEKYGDEP